MKFPTQGEILIALSKGAVITVEHIHDPHSDARTVYRLSSDNRTIRSDLFERMLKDELIKANNDGLPGFDEASQTYSFRRSDDPV